VRINKKAINVRPTGTALLGSEQLPHPNQPWQLHAYFLGHNQWMEVTYPCFFSPQLSFVREIDLPKTVEERKMHGYLTSIH
jgi:hypothetical protein